MMGHPFPSVLRGEFARLAAGGRTAPRVSGGKKKKSNAVDVMWLELESLCVYWKLEPL